MAEPSASAVLAFLAAAAAPAAVELLLSKASGRSEGCGNGDGKVELQEQCARTKTAVAEWDGLLTSHRYLFHRWESASDLSRPWRSGNGRADPAIHVSARGHRGVHYAR
jgi:hypothetical protein